jgi:hypothetical protein
VFFVLEEKSISSHPSDENKILCQEYHVKEKQPSIDIHEEIYFHKLAYDVKEGIREVDQ